MGEIELLSVKSENWLDVFWRRWNIVDILEGFLFYFEFMETRRWRLYIIRNIVNNILCNSDIIQLYFNLKANLNFIIFKSSRIINIIVTNFQDQNFRMRKLLKSLTEWKSWVLIWNLIANFSLQMIFWIRNKFCVSSVYIS